MFALGLEEAGFRGRISSHCWRKWCLLDMLPSPFPPVPAATLRGHPIDHLWALSSLRALKGKDIFGRKVPSALWESPVAR